MKKLPISILLILLITTLYAKPSFILNSPLKSNYIITRTFGYYKNSSDVLVLHEGIDFEVKSGTDVYPAFEGTVTEVGFNNESGMYITILHDNGFKTRYCNLNTFRCKKGERVKTKKIIATSGNTGISTGPHMCFRLYNLYDEAINPTEYFKELPEPTTPPDQELLNSSFQTEEISNNSIESQFTGLPMEDIIGDPIRAAKEANEHYPRK